MHVGQAVVAALQAECQARMVDAQTVQNGRVQIVNVDRILDDVVAEIIRLAVDQARPDAAAQCDRRKSYSDVCATAKQRPGADTSGLQPE